MNNDNKHIINNKQKHLVDDLFTKADVAHAKSKNEIWNELVNKIDSSDRKINTTSIKSTRAFTLNLIYGIAATILLLTGLFSVLRYYNTTINSPSNQVIITTLPDGSTVTLASNSSISYYPLWWQFSRRVSLKGEAFFNVEKGKQFNITSSLGKTIVLGTSFNIFSRGDEYKVTCITGKVKVVSITKQQVILTPNYHAELTKNGEILVSKTKNINTITSWRDNMFSFRSVPLQVVINEIEYYYNIKITLNSNSNYSYTGFFSKQKSAEEVLKLLCKPFGITFIKKAEGNYEIIQ